MILVVPEHIKLLFTKFNGNLTKKQIGAPWSRLQHRIISLHICKSLEVMEVIDKTVISLLTELTKDKGRLWINYSHKNRLDSIQGYIENLGRSRKIMSQLNKILSDAVNKKHNEYMVAQRFYKFHWENPSHSKNNPISEEGAIGGEGLTYYRISGAEIKTMTEPCKRTEIVVGKKMDLNRGVFHKDILSDQEQAKLLVKTNYPPIHKNTDTFSPYSHDQRKKTERKQEGKRNDFSLFPPKTPANDNFSSAEPRQRG